MRPESGACTATSVTGLIQGLRPPAAWQAPGDPGPLASPQEVPRDARTAGAAWPSEGRPEKGPGRRARGGRAGRGAGARGGTRAETGRGRGTPCGGGAEARGGAQSGGRWKASLEQSAGDAPSGRRPAGREPARGGKCGRAAPLGASVGGREACSVLFPIIWGQVLRSNESRKKKSLKYMQGPAAGVVVKCACSASEAQVWQAQVSQARAGCRPSAAG